MTDDARATVAWVPVQAGDVVYALPEMTAALLEQNLRQVWGQDDHWGEAALSAADKLSAARVGKSTAVVDLRDERVVVLEALDAMLAGPHESPTLLAIFHALKD